MQMSERVRVGGKVHVAAVAGEMGSLKGAKPFCGQTNRKVHPYFEHPEATVTCKKCLTD